MASTRKTKRRLRTARRAFICLAVLALAVSAYVVAFRGGQGGVPTWTPMYAAFGVPLDAPDAELLAASPTTVTVLDVGQGDAVLIGQDGEYCLIDTGTADTADALARSLQLAGVERLRYLVLTHPHADHTGGAAAVLEALPVETLLVPVWDPPAGESSAWPRAVLEQAAAAGVPLAETSPGDCFALGSGTLQVLQGGSALTVDEDDANNGSLCLLFTAGGFRYLATGDAEEEAEQALVDEYGRGLHAVLYKAGHHGSSTSSSEALLSVVQPQAAVISCGRDNDYGHPHAEVLRRLAACGVDVYRTDEQGTLTFTYQNGTLQATLPDEEAQDAAA